MRLPLTIKKRFLLLALIIITLATYIGLRYWQNYSNVPNKLKDAAVNQEKFRFSDAQQNNNIEYDTAISQVDGLNNTKKYSEAKTGLDKLEKQYVGDKNRTEGIYNEYVTTCIGLVDTGCMDKILNFYKVDNKIYTSIGIDFADAAKAANKPEYAKKVYGEIYAVVTLNGGKSFIDDLNKNSKERSYDYDQIKQGAAQ